MIRKIKNIGFSLVEVVVASVIFTIAAAGLFATFSTTRGGSSRGQHRLEAAYLERQLLEELRSKIKQPATPNAAPPDWSDFTCDNTSYPWPIAVWPYPSNPITDNFGGQVNYICQQYVAPSPQAGATKMSLTVTWNEPAP